MYFKLGKRYWINISGEIIVPIIVLGFAFCYYVQVISLSFESLLLVKPLLYISFTLSLFFIVTRGIKITNTTPSSKKIFSISTIIKNVIAYKKTLEAMISFWVLLIFSEKIGFIITSFLYLILLMYLLGEKKIFRAALISILLILLVYSLFQFWFHVPLPSGILENYLM